MARLQLSRRQDEFPNIDQFIRSAYQSLVVIGNYLYAVGGEVGQFSELKDKGVSLALNLTLSIPLTQSWTTASVPIRAIDIGSAPTLKQQAIWLQPRTSSFYTFGGEANYGKTVPDRTLWRFNADGNGGGSWRQDTSIDTTVFSTLSRTFGGSICQANDTGLVLGGYARAWTDNAYPSRDKLALPGLVSFNLTSKVWANETASPYYAYGTSMFGGAQYLPSFGPNGLVLFFGGSSLQPGVTFGTATSAGILDMNNITIYDPIAKDWHWQFASGDIPSRRDKFCSVSVRSPNNTYEIFVYGGYDPKNDLAYDDLYVLSIPAFTWIKAGQMPGGPRAFHGCALIGKRQMISMGGINWALETDPSWTEVDPLPRGIGLFDLTDMKNTTTYNPSASSYESPKAIRDWYAAGKVSSVPWTSKNVKDLFTRPYARDTLNPNGPGKDDQAAIASANAKIPIGAIVGAIAGSLCILSLILFFLCYRRKKSLGRKKTASIQAEDTGTESIRSFVASSTEWYKPELDSRGIQPSVEMDAVKPLSELDAVAGQRHELYSPGDDKFRPQIHELESPTARKEQDGQSIKARGKIADFLRSKK